MKTVIFDVDGVLLSEKRYFDVSALTAWEWYCSPSFMNLGHETVRAELTDEEIDRFIQTISQERDGYIPEGRIKNMTFNRYFDYASIAFRAAGFDTKGMTPYEQFRRYGEDFGGNLLLHLF